MGCGRGLSFANVSTATVVSDTEVSPIHKQAGGWGWGRRGAGRGGGGEAELATYQKSQGFLSE